MPSDWRKRQGCDGPSRDPVAMLPDGTALFECPGKSVTPETARVCSLYPYWDKGSPIGAPCAIDESATLAAALRLVGSEVAAFHEETLNRGR